MTFAQKTKICLVNPSHVAPIHPSFPLCLNALGQVSKKRKRARTLCWLFVGIIGFFV